MVLTVVSCFVPFVGYFFAGTFGIIALILIIVAMSQGDKRGLPLLIAHIILTPLGCLFATITSCGAMLATSRVALAAIATPTPLSGSSVNRYQTPPVNISSPGLKTAVAASSTPEPTVAAASTPAFEMIPSTSVVSAITSNRWTPDTLVVSGTLTNTTAVAVKIANISAAGFNKNEEAVVESSENTIVHNDLAPGETVAFTVTLKDDTKQIRFVKVKSYVAKQ